MLQNFFKVGKEILEVCKRTLFNLYQKTTYASFDSHFYNLLPNRRLKKVSAVAK